MKHIAYSIRYTIAIVGLIVSINAFSQSETHVPLQHVFDSDGDGVFDNVDIDDDNDGIPDSAEESNCAAVGGNVVNYKFLNETFGAGTGRFTINANNDAASTTFCFEDGSVESNTAACPNQSSWILDAGEYCVVSKITGTSASDPENIYGNLEWYNGEDHTPNDLNGRMAVFNASTTPEVFYEATVTGVLSNSPITYSFWALNIMSENAFLGSILPDISVQFLDLEGNILSTYNTNPIGRCMASTTDNTCGQSEWHQYNGSVTIGNTNSFIVRLINNATGGYGNNLAIDDIVISQTLCDTDSDGVADLFDLDSDNDGIPDVVEAGLGHLSEGTATLSYTSGWMDSNNNGMHDATEGFTILNSDSDTTPNYLDLDSDNDTIFDVDESKAGNTANMNFENGDGDINGDGVGDGLDTDFVREQDVNADGITELLADGILDIYDYHNGATLATAYGNRNQGLGSTYYVLDTDTDGIPDYIDISSNGSSFDISRTLYANLDTNNNGCIGGLNYNSDVDKDGILDVFDTDDARFGSPRDLDGKLELYFDGRNDYIEDSELLSGMTNATIMGWIKIDPSFTSGLGVLFGQNNLELLVKPVSRNYYIAAIANETTAANDITRHPINANRWYHVAATYNGNNGEITLFINGERINTVGGAGSTLSTNTDKFTIGKEANSNDKYFKGFIDEVRVFNKTLSDNEIQKMVYQEIEENSGMLRGSVIPKDITDFASPSNINPLDWPSLLRYYRMDVYKDNIIDDLTTPGYDMETGAKLYNAKRMTYQTAPMPFVTHSSGSLTDAVNLPLNGINGEDVATYDWSIVKVEHNNVSFNNHQKHLGLFINEIDETSTPIEYKVNNDSELNVSWYLELNGFIDLEGESQLVQGFESDLVVGAHGRIEKDQQGTQDLYTYNYWSSPVGVTATGTANNFKYTLNNNIFKDGTDPETPVNISFIGGYDGSNSDSSIRIAHYWIWKFNNRLSDNYPSWQHIRNTGEIFAGEGFTMKGVANTNGNVSLEQNYVFDGKPNNGNVSLEVFAGNDYLIGNPYASAIDAEQFIRDNGPNINEPGSDPIISGTLYFWKHWGGGSHISSEYQGGYGTYNYSGGLPPAAFGESEVAQSATERKKPGRYIPVGQGFFIAGKSDGFINFNNGQRVFQKEGTTASVFMRDSENDDNSTVELDERVKIRLGFNSVNTIQRQLLVTADERASIDYDWGFDAELKEEQMDDMFWIINDTNYIIQGIDTFSDSTILPIGIRTRDDGLNSITIDILENVPDSMEIYAHDKDLNLYHDLRASDYEVFLESGEYLDRFEITFTNQSLSVDDYDIGDDLQVFYVNSKGSIVIQNPKLVDLKSAEMFNIIGQSISRFNNIDTKQYLELKTNTLSTGTYILNLKTTNGKEIKKKVLVK